MLIPTEGHSTQAEAIAAQAAASEATRNRLWKQIVRAKINAQAELLERLRIEAGALREMTRRVRTGDRENLEAQAALLVGGDGARIPSRPRWQPA
jgi:CRISPR-associated protein Cas1